MTHYSSEENRVRVDIFHPDGTWYETMAVLWTPEPDTDRSNHGLLQTEFKRTICRALGQDHLGKIVVCLKPFHPNAYPVMLVNYQYEL